MVTYYIINVYEDMYICEGSDQTRVSRNTQPKQATFVTSYSELCRLIIYSKTNNNTFKCMFICILVSCNACEYLSFLLYKLIMIVYICAYVRGWKARNKIKMY